MLDAVFDKFLEKCKSVSLRTMEEFAEQEIVLPSDGGPHEGEPFRLERQPYVRLLWNEIQFGPWIQYVIAGPTQSGKTLCAFVIPVIYEVVEICRNIALGIPDGDMVNDKWKVDIEPVFRASKTLDKYLPNYGPGSRAGKVREYVQMANGVFLKFFTRAGSDQSKAGFTTSVAKLTEAAGWTRGTETTSVSNPFGEISGRLRAISKFTDDGELNKERSITLEGTFTNEYELPYTAKQGSTESVIVSQCPYCKEWVSPEREHFKGWENAKSELEAARLGRFHCPECDHKLDDSDRSQMNAGCKLLHKNQTITKRGVIKGEPPETSTLWFRWSAFQNEFIRSADIAAEEWLAAQHEPESRASDDAEKQLCQQLWALPYTPKPVEHAPLDRRLIRKKQEQFTVGVIPPDTEHLVFGVDLGRWRLWYFGIAARQGGPLHCPAYGSIDTSIIESQVTQEHEHIAILTALNELFDIMESGWPHMGSASVKVPDLVLTDSGYFPAVAFQACKRDPRYMPILGRGRTQLDARRYMQPNKRSQTIRDVGDRWHIEFDLKHRGPRMVVDADEAKLSVQASLRVKEGKPGSLTLPRAPEKDHTTVSKHLASEVYRRWNDPDKGPQEEWKKTGQNHLLDCAAYALMGLRKLGWDIGAGVQPEEKKAAPRNALDALDARLGELTGA